MLFLTLLVALCTAIAFYPAIGLRSGVRGCILALLLAAILLSPLLIPQERRAGRLFAAIFAVALTVKLYDLHVGADRGHRPRFSTFLWFLPNLSAVVLRKLDKEPQPSRNENLKRLARTPFATAVAVILFVACYQVDWRPWPFALEHCVKVVTFFCALLPGVAMAVTLWRLLGGKAREPMNHPFAARTPAEFWVRYNRPAQQFFLEDLFKPWGGIHHLWRAGLITFAISAILHEYLFVISLGVIQGYQTAFFLIQGAAALATHRLKLRGWRAKVGILGTFAFNLATGVLFFTSVNQVLPFYAERPSRPIHDSSRSSTKAFRPNGFYDGQAITTATPLSCGKAPTRPMPTVWR